MYRRDSDSEKVPAAPYDRLTDTPTYAARMYKVQLANPAPPRAPVLTLSGMPDLRVYDSLLAGVA